MSDSLVEAFFVAPRPHGSSGFDAEFALQRMGAELAPLSAARLQSLEAILKDDDCKRMHLHLRVVYRRFYREREDGVWRRT